MYSKQEKRSIMIMSIFMTMFVIGLLISGWYDCHYSRKGYVQSNENNVVFLVDQNNWVWSVTDRPDLRKGNKVRIIFNTNCTDRTRTDDIIDSVRVLP